MKLMEAYNRLLIDGFWKNVEVSYMSSDVIIPARLMGLLQEADELIFKKFNINQSQKQYFIAGSARLHLEPKLKKIFNLKQDIGDLDVIIPDTKIWEKAIQNGTIPKDEVSYDRIKGYVYRPKNNTDIEVFSVWNPALAGKEYSKTTVRSADEIINDSVFIGGHYFMSIGDVMDYKLQMNREKEREVVELILKYKHLPDTDENMQMFFKKLVELLGERETEVLIHTIKKER